MITSICTSIYTLTAHAAQPVCHLSQHFAAEDVYTVYFEPKQNLLSVLGIGTVPKLQ